jgi:hypothetical protein
MPGITILNSGWSKGNQPFVDLGGDGLTTVGIVLCNTSGTAQNGADLVVKLGADAATREYIRLKPHESIQFSTREPVNLTQDGGSVDAFWLRFAW